jgi:hypothetical protein
MDYSKEVEELLIWFALLDWWERKKQDSRIHTVNP